MAKLTIEVNGTGTIDNAGIFLDDPDEKLPYYLDPVTDEDWKTTDPVSVPMKADDPLSYSLHVVAFTGTQFTATITNNDNSKKISISGVTGKPYPNRAVIKGTDILK